MPLLLYSIPGCTPGRGESKRSECNGFPDSTRVESLAAQGVENQVSGRQPRRAAMGEAQHTGRYVSIHPSRATPDHGPKRRFSTACYPGERAGASKAMGLICWM